MIKFTNYRTGMPITPDNALLAPDELIAKVLPVLQADHKSWRALTLNDGSVSFGRDDIAGKGKGSSSVRVSRCGSSDGVYWSFKFSFNFPGHYGLGNGGGKDENIHKTLLEQWKDSFDYNRERWLEKQRSKAKSRESSDDCEA